jgi:aryl-alcohol dehydrogenase-like predicted oxidoreductase
MDTTCIRENSMIRNRVGGTDLLVSGISLGALHFGVYLDEKKSHDLLSLASELDINFIDTGPLYGNGNSEKIVGKYICNKRSSFIISTKVGLDKVSRDDGTFGVSVRKLTRNNITKSLNESLATLNTDYIDILQLHAYDPETSLQESVEVLESLVRDGKIRTYGVSNYNPEQLKELLSILNKNDYKNLSCIESHYNMIERMIELSLLPLISRANISLIPYRSLARGVLSGKYVNGLIPEQSRAFDSWRVRNTLTEEVSVLVKTLSEEIKYKYGRSILDLAVAWLLAQDAIPTVLVGCRDKQQLVENVEASKWVLSAEILDYVDVVINRLGYKDLVQNSPKIYFEQ